MKKSILTLVAVLMSIMSVTSVKAQMINQTDLQGYTKAMYGTNFKRTATIMSTEYSLDNMGNLVYTKEISAPTMTKNELYMEMANWFVCNYENAIQFADKESGTLIARPYIENIARSAGGFDAYNVSIYPTVRANISDGKVNIIYTLHDYNVEVEAGGGNTATGVFAGLAAAAITGAVLDATSSHKTTVIEHSRWGNHHHTTVYRDYRPHHMLSDALLLSCITASATAAPSKDCKKWAINSCYPFVSKDKHKKASSKAFVMANVYSQVVIKNIEAALRQCAYACNK